ncbi:hypothetical protein ACFQX7_00350 [Luedemannella flava]
MTAGAAGLGQSGRHGSQRDRGRPAHRACRLDPAGPVDGAAAGPAARRCVAAAAQPGAPPSAPATGAPPDPAAADLTASYVVDSGTSSYVVTVANPGDVPGMDWVVTLVVPSAKIES